MTEAIPFNYSKNDEHVYSLKQFLLNPFNQLSSSVFKNTSIRQKCQPPRKKVSATKIYIGAPLHVGHDIDSVEAHRGF
jgi:hypothetical protein